MTAKEQQRMNRLEIENRELREQHAKHIQVYGDNLIQIIELKSRLELIEYAVRGDE